MFKIYTLVWNNLFKNHDFCEIQIGRILLYLWLYFEQLFQKILNSLVCSWKCAHCSLWLSPFLLLFMHQIQPPKMILWLKSYSARKRLRRSKAQIRQINCRPNGGTRGKNKLRIIPNASYKEPTMSLLSKAWYRNWHAINLVLAHSMFESMTYNKGSTFTCQYVKLSEEYDLFQLVW